MRYVHEFLSCLPKDYTCAMCSWGFKVIKEKIMLVRYVHEFLHVCQKIILGREWYTLYEPKECGLSIFLCWKAFTTLRAKSQSILVFVSCNLCIHIQTLDLKRCEIFDKRFARKYELWKHFLLKEKVFIVIKKKIMLWYVHELIT